MKSRHGQFPLLFWLLNLASCYFITSDACSENLVATFNGTAKRFIVDPNRNLVYASLTDGSVAIIDPLSLTLENTIALDGADGMSISPDGSTLYVAGAGSAISVINLDDQSVQPSILTDQNTGISDLVAGLDGRLYAINGDKTLVQIEASTGQTDAEILTVIDYPQISSDHKTLFCRTAASYFTGHTIYRYDVSSATAVLEESMFVGPYGWHLALSHDDRYLCVPTSSGSDAPVEVFDSGNFNTIYGGFSLFVSPSIGLTFNSNDTVIIAGGGFYDAQSLEQIATLLGDTGPVVTDVSGRYAFAAGGDEILVYDLLPIISDSISATVGHLVTYQVPTFFIADRGTSASGMPDGVTFDPVNTMLSGSPTQDGTFPVTITRTDGFNVASVDLKLTVYPDSRALNISTRLTVQTDDKVMIAGFIITGSFAKQVVLRAIGPSLEVNGVPLPGALANPTLELHDSAGSVIAFNDDWATDAQAATLVNLGIAPKSSQESAMFRLLSPGAYTVIVRGADNGTGIGLGEVYDVDPSEQTTDMNGSRLANISTRGQIGIGDNVMIGGVIVGGIDDANVVLRGIGPSLTAQHVVGALPDPQLGLYNDQGMVVVANDNWRDTQQSEIEATGLAPIDDKEAAILTSLAPGAYTAIVSGVGDSTGIGLVEAYNLP